MASEANLQKLLPRARPDEVKDWTSTPPPWERKDGTLYRENEVGQILGLLKSSDRKAVLLEGKGGAGKSSTIVELAHVLDKRGEKYALFSANTLTPDSFDNPSFDRLSMIIQRLDEYAQICHEPTLVLIDSGDYLFGRPPAGARATYLELREQMEAGKNLDPRDFNTLMLYEYYSFLLDVLANPQFKIVTTWHSDWDESKREPTLFAKWRKIIPEGSEYILSPKVSVEKGLEYLKSIDGLKTGSYAPVIAAALEFGELKNLNQELYDELEAICRSGTQGDWIAKIRIFASKKLHDGQRDRH